MNERRSFLKGLLATVAAAFGASKAVTAAPVPWDMRYMGKDAAGKKIFKPVYDAGHVDPSGRVWFAQPGTKITEHKPLRHGTSRAAKMVIASLAALFLLLCTDSQADAAVVFAPRARVVRTGVGGRAFVFNDHVNRNFLFVPGRVGFAFAPPVLIQPPVLIGADFFAPGYGVGGDVAIIGHQRALFFR